MYNSMYYNGYNPYIIPKPSFTKSFFGGFNKPVSEPFKAKSSMIF